MSQPLIQFVIGGVQKGGTTALAQFLSRHPDVRLPAGKEAHVFDTPGFDDTWKVADVDAQYCTHFAAAQAGGVHGDATPIYLFHPRFVERIARYNPGMKWIVLLRHPVERAVSQYQMESSRGDEHWPFWLAILFERWRLRGHREDFSAKSPLRHHSYVARGDYARQFDELYRHFPAQQVLIVRNEVLASDPQAVMAQVHDFLGIAPVAGAEDFGRIFSGSYRAWHRNGMRFSLLRWWMRRQLRRAKDKYGLDWA